MDKVLEQQLEDLIRSYHIRAGVAPRQRAEMALIRDLTEDFKWDRPFMTIEQTIQAHRTKYHDLLAWLGRERSNTVIISALRAIGIDDPEPYLDAEGRERQRRGAALLSKLRGSKHMKVVCTKDGQTWALEERGGYLDAGKTNWYFSDGKHKTHGGSLLELEEATLDRLGIDFLQEVEIEDWYDPGGGKGNGREWQKIRGGC